MKRAYEEFRRILRTYLMNNLQFDFTHRDIDTQIFIWPEAKTIILFQEVAVELFHVTP